MRKILCFIIAIMGFVNAQNNDDIKINVVKNFYNNSDLSENAKKFGTASFKTAISDGEAAGCLDFDPVVSGQEICDKPKYDFKAIGSDEVEVTQTCDYGGDNPLDIKTIVYALKCKQNECKVDDIFNFVKNDNGAKEKFSTKEYLFECVEEYVATESEANHEEFAGNTNNIQNNADSFAGNAKDKIKNFINNVENKVDEVKQMVNFEKPIVSIEARQINDFWGKRTIYPLIIQSRDNGTLINEIIINRGNCQISQQNKYEINKNKLNEYFQKNPKNFILYTSKEKPTSFTGFERKIINVKMKNGNMASLYKKYYDYAYHSIASRSKKFGDVIYSSNKKDSLQKILQERKNNNSKSNLARFDSLDDEIKALFKKVNIKVVLAYGETPYNQYESSIKCYFLGENNSIDIQDNNKIKKCIREQTTIIEYELIEEKAKEYAYKYSDNLSEAGNAHWELFVIELERALKKQDGSLIGVSDRSLNANDDKTMTYINSLDNESRSVYDYKPIYPMGPIDFGKILAVPYECSPKEVLEVILKTNGGDFKYMFEQN
ncbi:MULTISPECIES: hypothetical protein [unclassified Campylobacter]|uniref:hypothetical protein n=1 Tax=unclassified Campylobacter TaxID=2593542 RepID=UPI0022E9EA02|nr:MULTISPECIES: hypothetical protein [unclassified Campylobacter]MDA3056343.1 hypothetical protein [Campylobacter sp. CN_NA1]MDA3065526.1 hypothetical protein [Campylobacter sp. CN_NE4]MDA3068856.1 hypothetical protein [Campylobacter sp. CN_NE3]MDA3082979.1 hypothetical protein [Campylobacter sp. CN_EL2]MDA3084441.1 hypothetical protein [Campylobacter sp. CN_NE1]